jgi:hypothetical protein
MFDIDIPNLVIFIVTGVLTLTLIAIIMRQRFKLRNAANLIVQKIVDESILQDQLMRMRSEKALETNDDFIKFVSDSRDWAFNYIEDVQQAIQELKTSVESGYPTEEALIKLFNLLPEQQGENNEQGND